MSGIINSVGSKSKIIDAVEHETFPSGQVISTSTRINTWKTSDIGGSDVATSNTDYTDSGYEINITTKKSSSDTLLRITFFAHGWSGTDVGAGNEEAGQGMYYTFQRETLTNQNSYDSAKDVAQSVGAATLFYTPGTELSFQYGITAFDKLAHAASTKYFYRFYFRTRGSGNAIRVISGGGPLFFYVEEVVI